MAGKATVYDVAQRAGVSIATVSFAFTKPERVKAQTLTSVLQAADELGYVPSAAARGLARGRTGAIGLYSFDYLLEPEEGQSDGASAGLPNGRLFPLYADEVQRGVQLECRRRGFALMLGGTRTSPHLPQIIEVAGRVDGLIAFAGAVSGPLLRQVSSRIPVIELGGEVHADRARTILVDNRQGMADLTTHLLEVHGHRRFAYMGELGTPEFRQRFDGFTAALGAAGVPVPAILPSHAGNDETARASTLGLVEGEGLPDVIVCDTDQSALVVIDTLRSAGLAVPRDVAVTGFDGILAGRLISPALTTVRQPMEEIGVLAVRLLADSLDGRPDSDRPDLSSTLAVGGTCGCASLPAL